MEYLPLVGGRETWLAFPASEPMQPAGIETSQSPKTNSRRWATVVAGTGHGIPVRQGPWSSGREESPRSVRYEGFDFQGIRVTMNLLLLLWWSWTAYVWLGNRVRADRGLVRAGMLVAMASLFVAALVMPDAWSRSAGTLDAPLILALTFTIVRVVYFGLHLSSAVDDRSCTLSSWSMRSHSLSRRSCSYRSRARGELADRLVGHGVRHRLRRRPDSLRPGRLEGPQPGHFAERYRMVLIIVLGESLISA
jgi:hypothetical protein